VTARTDAWERRRGAEATVLRERLATLTPRELQVLRHVLSGQTDKQIAADLGTAEKPVKIQRGRVMEKMQAGVRPE
jgi:FixJ family two-component response regulator